MLSLQQFFPLPLLPQLFPFSLDYSHQHINNLLFHSSYKKKKTRTPKTKTGFWPHFLFQLLFLLIGKLLKGISYNCSLNFLPAFSLEPISFEFSSPAELCLTGSSVTSMMLLLKVNSQSSPCLTYKHCRTQMIILEGLFSLCFQDTTPPGIAGLSLSVPYHGTPSFPFLLYLCPYHLYQCNFSYIFVYFLFHSIRIFTPWLFECLSIYSLL